MRFINLTSIRIFLSKIEFAISMRRQNFQGVENGFLNVIFFICHASVFYLSDYILEIWKDLQQEHFASRLFRCTKPKILIF